MTTYLIDSDILIDLFKNKDYAAPLIEKLINRGRLTTSILSVAELRAGSSLQQASFLLPQLYDMVTIKSVTKEIAELAGRLRFEYKTRGISLPTVDTLIASTAITEKCQLVTRNKKDFPMPQLKFYPIG